MAAWVLEFVTHDRHLEGGVLGGYSLGGAVVIETVFAIPGVVEVSGEAQAEAAREELDAALLQSLDEALRPARGVVAAAHQRDAEVELPVGQPVARTLPAFQLGDRRVVALAVEESLRDQQPALRLHVFGQRGSALAQRPLRLREQPGCVLHLAEEEPGAVAPDRSAEGAGVVVLVLETHRETVVAALEVRVEVGAHHVVVERARELVAAELLGPAVHHTANGQFAAIERARGYANDDLAHEDADRNGLGGVLAYNLMHDTWGFPSADPDGFLDITVSGCACIFGGAQVNILMPPNVMQWINQFGFTYTDPDETAHLIAAAYRGHIDSEINDQYRSAAGARRFLFNIVQYPGCGSFFAAGSWVALNRGTGRLCGVSLSSMVAADVGHITQICVTPNVKGKGIGYELLRQSMLSLAEAGARTVSLTVTAVNCEAIALYERVGFRVARQFPALVWEGF